MKRIFLLCYIPVIVFSFGLFSKAVAQNTFASLHPKTNVSQKDPQESANSVIFFLNKLETVHKVNFVYQRELSQPCDHSGS